MRLGLILLCAFLTSQIAFAETGGTTATMQESQSTADKNKQASETFLNANSSKKDIVTLPNGLQYKILNNGKGMKPTENDIVVVDYAGTLIDGTEFDSSYKRGQPASFPVSAVIPGWTQALQMMNEGSTWMLYLPPTLAYGERGAPPAIGPNEALIFKVHLIEVKKQ